MTDLPCTVVAVLLLAYLGTVAGSAYQCNANAKTPETPAVDQEPNAICFDELETGSEMSNEERQSAVDAVNLYRAFIANQCENFKSGKPKSANFRKIRYSCAFEKQVAFDCPANANDEFKTSGKVFRHIELKYDGSVFYRSAPDLNTVEINGTTLDFVDNSVALSQTMRFYLNGDATEIGCYQKVCHDKDYIACTTGTQVQTSGALYTAGTRCRSNFDCKYSQYRICDTELGLCQQGNLPYQCGKPDECAYLEIKPEACSRDVKTDDMGSLMSNEERRFVVEAINLMRGFITNQCAFKNGKPKSANLRKVRYNCKLEERAKFDCPANPRDDSDENVLRIHFKDKEKGSRTSVFYRKTPVERFINLNADGKPVEDFYGRDLFAFSLNPAATEVGCFLRLCNGHDTMECVAGVPFHADKPLYKPGNRCQMDADCKEPGYPVCDLDYGLCGPLVCKFSDSSLTVDACKGLRQCTEATGRTESERHFCRSTVIIAERDKVTSTFTVEGFGAAVGDKYLLTSVSAEFEKSQTTDLYAIVGGSKVFPLRKDGVNPQMHHGSFDINAWQDLILVKLSDKSTSKFEHHLKIKKASQSASESGSQDDLLTVCPHSEGIHVKSVPLKTDGECETIFDEDPFADYVPNSSMACGRYDHDIGTRFLSGAPLVDVALTDGHYTLRGIRSEPANSPRYRDGFLVTKLAPNCEWLESVSGGDVKCI